MDCSLPGSPVPGISQAGILEWVAISFSTGSSQPMSLMSLSWAGEFFSIEPPGKPKCYTRTVNIFTNIYSVF